MPLTRGTRRHVVVLKQRPNDLKCIAQWLASNQLKTYIAKQFSIQDIEEATRFFEAGGAQGKVGLSNHFV